MYKCTLYFALAALLFISDTAWAGEETINQADTAWILVSTALVLLMTMPGLALFYGGLVNAKNILSVLMHCLLITCVTSIIWLVGGYSLAFGEASPYIGGLDKAFLNGVSAGTLSGTIPEYLFFAFQMTFFVITPALIVGAFVERMKLSAMLLFVALWSVLVYAPVCHWVWGGNGFMYEWGVKDLAGGIVVHITAGVASLVASVMVGARKGFPQRAFTPHNLPMCITGAGLLWVGWFGFNAGSGLTASGDAAQTLVVTHLSACVATLVWALIEKMQTGRVSALGAATGLIAGLAAITPASGDVGPLGAIVIGAASAMICQFASTKIKMRFAYDDSLDVVGVHGVGGLVGTLLVAVFASSSFGGKEEQGYSVLDQLWIQFSASGITIVYTLVLSVGILYVVKAVCGGLRVSDEEEERGLDLSVHGEDGYVYGDVEQVETDSIPAK
ncbi:MAG: ammonium transporter [Myxococcota bacterium]|nr:ammonium transporter [Myxococcota bacterium]